MKIIELTEETMVDGIISRIQNQEEGIVWGITKYTNVFCGRNNSLNEEYCREHKIPMFKFPNEGGVVVVHVGDLSIGHFSFDVDNRFNRDLMNEYIEYLRNKGLNATQIDNDLIIDDVYKCGSYSSRRYGDILYSAFHVSVGMNLENIKNICTKPMTKIPRGLSDYGITTEEIQDVFIKYIKDLDAKN